MKISEIEALPAVQEATRVLQELEQAGLVEPAIASGRIRGYLTGIEPSDIDVAYVGPVPPPDARRHLRGILNKLAIDPAPWDIDGIWNAELAYGVKHTVDNYLLYYVSSIDTVYLTPDGHIYDPTGHGFADAKTKTLRLNDYDSRDGRIPTAKEEVYVCMEGCRRITKFGWQPTADSADRIQRGITRWQELSPKEQAYFIQKKILGKYTPMEQEAARILYAQYGWEFVFDAAATAKQ